MEFRKLSEFQRLLFKWRDKEAYRDYKFFLSTRHNPPVLFDHPYKVDVHFKHSGTWWLRFLLPGSIRACSKKLIGLLKLASIPLFCSYEESACFSCHYL